MIDYELMVLKEKIQIVFDLLFQGPPSIDCSDQFDGENLALLSGIKYSEMQSLIEGDLDVFSLFSVVPCDVGKYYLGGYLLYYVDEVIYSRRTYPLYNVPCALFTGYYSMIGFLMMPEVEMWILSITSLRNIVVDVLDCIVNNSAFGLNSDERKDVMSIRRRLSEIGAEE